MAAAVRLGVRANWMHGHSHAKHRYMPARMRTTTLATLFFSAIRVYEIAVRLLHAAWHGSSASAR
jgi:hypothetical protein